MPEKTDFPVLLTASAVAVIVITLTFAVFPLSGGVLAAPGDQMEGGQSFFFQTSLYTQHWGEEDNRITNNHQGLFNLEYYGCSSRLYGIARFINSFYQPSYYIYTGRSYKLFTGPGFEIKGKLTYGIIHGYDDEDGKHTSIYARLGTFPAFIPLVGIKKGSFELGLLPFSNEGAMVTMGVWF